MPTPLQMGIGEAARRAHWQRWVARASAWVPLFAAGSAAIVRLVHGRRQRRLQLQSPLSRLTESEDRLRRLYESTPAMLHAIDPAGCLTMVSDAWLDRLGYTRPEVMGRPSVDFLTAASREYAVTQGLPTLLARGRQDDLELQMVTRSGEVIDVLLSARVERDGAGQPTRIVAGLQDVTLRRRAERALQAEKQRLQNIVDGTHAGVWEWNVQSGALHLNERSAAMLGHTGAEPGEQTMAVRRQGIHPDDLQAADTAIQRHLTGQADFYEVEYRARHRDGHWVWILARGRLMTRTANGQPEWVFGIHQDITLRKQQEQALRKSEDFLARTGRLAGIGGWELDVATGAVTWSVQTRLIHGVAPDYQPLLDSAIDFYAPPARPVIQAAVAAGMTDGTPWDLELPFIRADGRAIWVRSVGTVEFADGRPVRLAGAFQDITERKQLAHHLADKERLLRQVVDSVPGLIAHIGPDRRYTMVNRAYTAWDRRSRADIVGHTVADVHGDAGFALLKPHLDRAFEGQCVDFELNLRRGQDLRAMQVTYVPDHDDAGRVIGVFSMKVDVTPLRRAEEQLRLVMEASPQGMFTADLDGRCTYANPAWQRIAGLTLAQSLKADLRRIVHRDDLAQVSARRRDAVAQGGVHTSEHRYVRPDGSIVWVRGHVTLMHREGAPDQLVGTVEDITERRRLDQALAAKSAELARSNEDLERFAYVASHDLQEPLRMVTSYGQLLVRRHQADLKPEAQEFLQFMVDGGQRAQSLIRDLLSLARLDSQARPWQAVPLERVLADTLGQFRIQLQECGATVTHDALPAVMADAQQMGQLLANLIGNALKFRGLAAPAIHVGAVREAGAWRISVQDNGIGIDPKFFERIFVMFQRLHLRSEHEGTGIGLAICKKVVERRGGRIGVQSAPGRGSTFFFTLPDRPGAPQAGKTPRQET